VTLVIVLLLACSWLVYHNRLEFRKMGGGEPSEYKTEVDHRFTKDLERFKIDISESIRIFGTNKQVTERPKMNGRVAYLKASSVKSQLGDGDRIVLTPESIHSDHFWIPRSKRADEPAAVRTIIWNEPWMEYHEVVNGTPHYLVTVHVYDMASRTYWRSKRIRSEDAQKFVFELAGG
jgi:hypothetical protein